MFGIRLFEQNGKDNYTTPTRFTEKARKDINEHLKNLDIQNNKKLLQLNLKYGSSPLRNDITTTSSNTNGSVPLNINSNVANNNNNNDDAISIESDNSLSSSSSNSSRKKFMKLFTTNSNKSNKLSTKNIRRGSTASSAESAVSFDTIETNHSNNNNNSDVASSFITQTSTINNNSLFSNPLSLIYTNSSYSTINQEDQLRNQILNQGYISLENALPSNYNDMYSPDLLTERFSNGRPIFTKRNLKDWEINDIRSLLIHTDIDQRFLTPSGELPEIMNNKLYDGITFHLVILPLNSSDSKIIDTLTNCDIYKESNFSYDFRYKTAKSIVDDARIRHARILMESYQIPMNYFNNDGNLISDITLNYNFNMNNLNDFSKFEWRNIIDNFLLNLSVENQCRLEFKQNCQIIKRQKLKIINDLNYKSSQTLLAQAILNNNLSNNLDSGANTYSHNNNHNQSAVSSAKVNVKLSDDERRKIWNDVQRKVYNSLNLDLTSQNEIQDQVMT